MRSIHRGQEDRHEDRRPRRRRDRRAGQLRGVAGSGCRRRSASWPARRRKDCWPCRVGVGLGVLAELMDEEVDDVVGPKGRHDPDRSAVRHGHEAGEVTLGGRRVRRPPAGQGGGRVERGAAAHVPTLRRPRPADGVVLEQMLAGVSTRRFSRTREPVGQDVVEAERSTSKSAVSREFVGRTARAPARADEPAAGRRAPGGADARRDRAQGPLLRRRARDHDRRHQDPARACGTARRRTRPSRRICSPTSSIAAWTVEQGVLVVLDGGKALRAAVRERASARSRCSAASATRNATSSTTCPSATARRSSGACARPGSSPTTAPRSTASSARRRAQRTAPRRRRIATRGPRRRPSRCSGSGSTAALAHPLEHEPDRVDDRDLPRTSRNVKHWQNGDMCLRWTAAGMLEAERQFRKIIGYRHLARLAVAVEADVTSQRAADPPTLTPPSPPRDRPGRYARDHQLITGPPPRSSTATGTTSPQLTTATTAAAVRCRVDPTRRTLDATSSATARRDASADVPGCPAPGPLATSSFCLASASVDRRRPAAERQPGR